MGKPPIEVYEAFKKKYFALCDKAGLEQYLVPYLMSSHPGSTVKDAVEMALWLKKWGYMPEQVQDFYPTPGTISTVMYYTGIHPMTGKQVYVATEYHEKQLQRALLQYSKPENANLVREALRLAGREDLIGNTPDCLVRPAFGEGRVNKYTPERRDSKKGIRPSGPYRSAKNGRSSASSSAKKTKIDKIFGADADRIKREAARMSSSPKASAKSGVKNGKKTSPSTKNAKKR